MTKQETYDYLRAHGVDFEITEHPAVFNMEECADLALPYPEDDAKKRSYYLITVRCGKRVDLKEFQRRPGTRRLSFASPEELLRLLDLTPGSVTPLGLLNDRDHAVRFCLDRDFDGGRIGVHPNDNTATVWLSVRALLALLRDRGTEIELVEI